MKTPKLNPDRYRALLAEAAPRVIRNDKELDRFTALLLELDERPRPTAEERELAELLTMLIEQYEAKHHAISGVSAVEVLRFLMEQHGLSAKDLCDVFGSKGTTSEVLNGKRKISTAAAAKLGLRFCVHPSVFIDWDPGTRGEGQLICRPAATNQPNPRRWKAACGNKLSS